MREKKVAAALAAGWVTSELAPSERRKNRAVKFSQLMYPERMQTVKEQVLHVLQRLPDDADFRDVNEEIALLAAVAGADIREGRLVDNNEMKARLDEWLDA